MPALVFKALLSYLESHPDVVEQLIEQAVTALVNAIKAHNAAK